MDFTNLWSVFQERGVQNDEVVIVSWTREHYRFRVYKWLSRFMPKLAIWVYTEEGYRLWWDRDYRPDYTGIERLKESQPLVRLKPPVMEWLKKDPF
jgi:hypothetical protein